jgi:hypothetical protein
MLGGGAISWVSRKQKSVSLSTAEAEYVASEAVKEALSLRNLLKGILRKDFTIPIYNDNKLAVKLTSDESSLKKIRHIDIRYHFIRECSQNEKGGRYKKNSNYLKENLKEKEKLVAGPRRAPDTMNGATD